MPVTSTFETEKQETTEDPGIEEETGKRVEKSKTEEERRTEKMEKEEEDRTRMVEEKRRTEETRAEAKGEERRTKEERTEEEEERKTGKRTATPSSNCTTRGLQQLNSTEDVSNGSTSHHMDRRPGKEGEADTPRDGDYSNRQYGIAEGTPQVSNTHLQSQCANNKATSGLIAGKSSGSVGTNCQIA